MDAKSAQELLDRVCEEIAELRGRPGRTPLLRRLVRPVGLGLLLSVGGAGAVGCGVRPAASTDGSPEERDGYELIPGADTVYGMPDAGFDLLPAAETLYGMPDLAPPDAGFDLLPGADSVYGMPDTGSE